MLATVLLEDGKGAEALSEFESVLQREPNRLRAIAGAAAEQAGEAAKARSYHQRVVELTDGHDGSRPEVARARQHLARG